MKDPLLLTPGEFEVIEVLWSEEKPLSVGEVLRVVRKSRAVAYTTVMTVLDKLARKGSLSRSKRGKAYLYRARVQRSEVLNSLVRDFAHQYFGGSRRCLRSFLGRQTGLRSANPSPATPPAPAAMDVVLL